MTPSRRNVPALPVPLLRDAIGRETARMSLRRAATAISISPNGLRNFLNGSAPRSATRAKLERWLAEQQHVSRPPNVGQLVRLLNELAGDLSTQQTAHERSEEHTSELQTRSDIVCRLLLEKKKNRMKM